MSMTPRRRLRIACIAALAAGSVAWMEAPPSGATSATANLTVSATVAPNCVIQAGSLDFGLYDPMLTNATVPRNASANVTLACTRASSPSITIDLGKHESSGGRYMQITTAGLGDTLCYEIYQPPSPAPGSGCSFPGTKPWGVFAGPSLHPDPAVEPDGAKLQRMRDDSRRPGCQHGFLRGHGGCDGKLLGHDDRPARSAPSTLVLVLFGSRNGECRLVPGQPDPDRADSKASATRSITVRNDGEEPVVVQSSVLAWTQEDGKDIYASTTEALVTPPIMTIAAGAEQIVRVGLRRPPDPRSELAYRVFLQEVPPPPKPGFTGLQVALRVGLPVFVAPGAPAARRLEWSAADRRRRLDPACRAEPR